VTIVDLTHPFDKGVYNPPPFPDVLIGTLQGGTGAIRDTVVSFVVHVGTHIDAPLHVCAGGGDARSLDLAVLVGPAVAWPIPCDQARAIDASELAEARPVARPGDRVFLATGWERYFRQAERYARHPHLSAEAAEWLLEQGVSLIGMDTPTPDLAAPLRPDDFDYPVHRELLQRGVPIVENLANLEAVVGRRFVAYVCPLPIVGADGAPARVLARLGSDEQETR
jgi:arylformamidase